MEAHVRVAAWLRIVWSMLGLLMNLLVAEKSGFQLSDNGDVPALKEFADRMTQQVMDALKEAAAANAGPAIRMSGRYFVTRPRISSIAPGFSPA